MVETVYKPRYIPASERVNVRISDLQMATLTNELGQYHFNGLVSSTYTLELLNVGFGSQTVVVLIPDDQTTSVKTALSIALETGDAC